jgi:hypothetical protein
MRIKFEDWEECKKIMHSIAHSLEDEFVDIGKTFNGVEQIIQMIETTDKLHHSDEIKIRKIITNLRLVAGMYDITGYNYKSWLSKKVNDTREMFEYYDVK